MNNTQKILALIIVIMLLFAICAFNKNTKQISDNQDILINKNWSKWIRKNSNPIESLTDHQFKDLFFLEEYIGNRTIIQLGESSHGVKEFNQIKVRIIKYLHQKLNFNVIAFESGMFECYNTNKIMDKDPNLLIESIFSVWRTQEVLELFKYIISTKETDRPLILAGFDFQISGDWRNRSKMLREIMFSINQDFANKIFKTDSIFALTKKQSDIEEMRSYVIQYQNDLKCMYSKLKNLLEQNMPLLTAKYNSDPLIPLFAYQIASSMLLYIDFWLDEENEMAIRDKAMAENVNFLRDKMYPDKKIIIWAHNLHIRHRNEQLDLSSYEKIKSMGSWLYDKYPEDIYTIGLYMYRGQAANNHREVYNLQSHLPNSLESILYSTGYNICFVDLNCSKITSKNDWITSEINTKSWGIKDLKLVPANQYDAIILIDSVSPPKYIN